jgi:hypothetical protein
MVKTSLNGKGYAIAIKKGEILHGIMKATTMAEAASQRYLYLFPVVNYREITAGIILMIRSFCSIQR